MADGILLTRESEEKQRYTRASIICDGCLEVGGQTVSCKILDISAGGAKIETAEPLAPAGDVVLQIGDLIAFPGTVVWRQDRQTGIEFAVAADTVVQVLPEIFNGPAKSQEKRDHLRSAVLWSGEVIYGARTLSCRILNISAAGAKVQLDGDVPDGAKLRIACARFGEMPARVIWQSGDKLGLEFLEDPTRVLRAIGNAIAPLRGT